MHDIFSKKKSFSFRKGQGSLEYLLLIGGTVLVATIVLLVIISSTNSTNDLINTNLATYQNQINLGTGTGGGNPPVNCGNAVVDLGEACDDTATPVYPSANPTGLCDLYNSALYSRGDLTCSGCTVGTDSCVLIVTDADTPNFSAFTASAPNSYGGTVRVNLGWTASDATTPIQYAGANPGLAREDGGQTILNTMTVANFSGQPTGIIYGSPANDITTFLDTDSSIDDTGLLVGQQSCYNMMYCDSVSPTPNCAVNPVGSIVCATPWQAVIIEAESFIPSASSGAIQIGSHTDTSVPPVIEPSINDDATACTSVDNTAEYPNMLNFSDHLNTRYYSWARMATNDTTTSAVISVRARFGAVGFQYPIPTGTSPGTDFRWVQATTQAGLPDGLQSFTLSIPCGNTGTGESTWVDKVLFTTDGSCTPFGDGSNCT